MKRDMSLRFVSDGRDGWRPVSDIPASTELERAIVARRIAEDIAAARTLRAARSLSTPRPVRVRLLEAFGTLRPRATRPASAGGPDRTHARVTAAPAAGAPRSACQG